MTASQAINLSMKLVKNDFGHCPNFNIYCHQLSIYAHKCLSYVNQGDVVLDVGHGYGGISIAVNLIGCEVDAVDFYVDPPKYQNVNWLKADIEDPNYKFACLKYDKILMNEVLEHMNFLPDDIIERLFAALKSNGKFILTVPTKGKYLPDPGKNRKDLIPFNDNTYRLDDHVIFWSDEELIDMFTKYGDVDISHLLNHTMIVCCKNHI